MFVPCTVPSHRPCTRFLLNRLLIATTLGASLCIIHPAIVEVPSNSWVNYLGSFPDCLNKVIAMSLNALEIYLTKSRKIIVQGNGNQLSSSAAVATFNRNLISLGFVCSQELTGALADLSEESLHLPPAGRSPAVRASPAP